ncbi:MULTISPECIES: hypothetical protein [unclassified Pseudomonas]|uniref:hypothetical protein n=1 Tax=unclassified Pseudomonas TaxID=196821 RepID=UPI0011AF471B|nr:MULTISPECIES: hypothetical protein [unclassified Pseudomonas]MBL1311245.1 hypothetical protein [Pseudomonas sp.]
MKQAISCSGKLSNLPISLPPLISNAASLKRHQQICGSYWLEVAQEVGLLASSKNPLSLYLKFQNPKWHALGYNKNYGLPVLA